MKYLMTQYFWECVGVPSTETLFLTAAAIAERTGDVNNTLFEQDWIKEFRLML